MEPMDTIASVSGAYSTTQLATNYAMRLTKMAMDDSQELALQELEQMLPPNPYTFDVYA